MTEYDQFRLEFVKNIARVCSNIPQSKAEIRVRIADLFDLQALLEYHVNRNCVAYYDGKHPKHYLWTGHYQFVVDNVPTGATVLDIGTGASLSYTQELAKKCKSVECCDNKSALVAQSIAGNKCSNVSYFVMDVTRQLPYSTYDVVILSHILEHLENPLDLLQRVKRITNKLIIRLPRYDDHWYYLVKKDLGLFYFKDRDHKREYTLPEALELLETAGWGIETALNDIDIKIVATIKQSES